MHTQPKEKEGVFKLTISLSAEAWHGFASEIVWAEVIDKSSMRILNSPFFAKGISYGDHVTVKVESNVILLDSIVKKSGHSTYRILLTRNTTKEAFQKKWLQIEQLGCTYESYLTSSIFIYSVDTPPSVDINKAYFLLEEGEHEELWEFEEGDYVAKSA